jgi:hypothetical protein
VSFYVVGRFLAQPIGYLSGYTVLQSVESTDVSEGYITSIFRVEEKAKQVGSKQRSAVRSCLLFALLFYSADFPRASSAIRNRQENVGFAILRAVAAGTQSGTGSPSELQTGTTVGNVHSAGSRPFHKCSPHTSSPLTSTCCTHKRHVREQQIL